MDGPLLGIHDSSERPVNRRTTALRDWLGAPLDIQNVFTAWDNRPGALDHLFDRLIPGVRAAGGIPLVTWEPFTPSPAETPDDVVAGVVAGRHDDYLREWFDRLSARTEEGDVILRLAHEPNGDWYPWASSGSYVEMWRRVRDIAESRGLGPEVTWLWAVNHVDTGPLAAEELYPGDRYVDTVGVDGFNWGTSRSWSSWSPPDAVFGDMVDRLRELTDRPLCVPETASSSLTERGHEPSRKDDWIRDLFSYLREEEIGMMCWFNIDKETDWAVFGGARGTERYAAEERSYAAYAAFRQATIGSPGRSG